MSRVTHVTMVPREGTRRCVPSPCLRPACLHLLRKLSWWRIQQVPFYTFGYLPMTSRATWTNRIGIVLHMLQVPVTQTAFPFRESVHQDAASRSLSGNHGYMSNPRRSCGVQCQRICTIMYWVRKGSIVQMSYIKLQPEFRKCWDVLFYFNKIKTKRLSNHMSQYFTQKRT